jgi:hypothetical protein
VFQQYEETKEKNEKGKRDKEDEKRAKTGKEEQNRRKKKSKKRVGEQFRVQRERRRFLLEHLSLCPVPCLSLSLSISLSVSLLAPVSGLIAVRVHVRELTGIGKSKQKTMKERPKEPLILFSPREKKKTGLLG